MKSPITIDFENTSIILNVAFVKKASNPFSPEYAQLQKVRADYPEFTVITRTIEKKPSKESYHGLTYDYMRAYIMSHEEGENRTAAVMEFDNLIMISQCHSKGHRYPTIKNWFLEKYPEVRAFGMVEIPGFKIVPKGEKKVADYQNSPEKKTA